MSTQTPTPQNRPAAQVYGVLAEFEDVTTLTRACRKVRDAGFKHWDAHTPFVVHGLDAAMGIRPTRLPWLILLCALIGGGGGIFLQWWTMAIDYPYWISGKPLFSLPAFIPVGFELAVLLSGFCAIFGTLAVNKLPSLFTPLHQSKRFRRATADRFFIFIEARDPLFEATRIQSLMAACAPSGLETLAWDPHGPGTRFPKGTRGMLAIGIALSMVPLALIARAREVPSLKPRIHILPDDMDSQYKFKAQGHNWLFADGSAMRRPPEGTLAHEQPTDPTTGLQTGKDVDGAYLTVLPTSISVGEVMMQRGQRQFNVYCAPCHGLSGKGDGMVSRRAEQLQEPNWVPPSSLHEGLLREQRDGEIYNTIVHGIRSMPAYGPHVDLEDRWAIVAYVRALQLTQHAPKSAVPADILPSLK